MRRFLLAAALAIPLLVGAAVAAPTQAQAATCSGVWVVVDYGSLGGTSTKCATSYGTGLTALRSAGFSPSVDGGFVLKIGGKPSNPDINQAYWSYWQATRSDDGTYSGWKYSNLGATASHPEKGNAEGWRYQSLADGKVPPAAAPPKADTSTPTPTPTKSSSKPKPTATKSATETATKSASATAKASSTTAPSTAKASSTTAPSTTKATTAATPFTTPSTTAPLSAGEVTEAAQDQVVPPTPTQDGGSPVGAIAAGSAVLAGAVGLGGWWLMRGRKR